MAAWNEGNWNVGTWNYGGTAALITGNSLTSSLGSVTIDAELRSGWSRGAYNSGSWGSPFDAYITQSGLSLASGLNWGFGWSRESWSEGAWNSHLGTIIAGTGSIFSITGE